jgi:glutamate racemase
MHQVEERVLDRSGGPLERLDLLAGASYAKAAMPSRAPTILVFDSGLGGLTVFREVTALIPAARYVYAADDAGFPYGRLDDAALTARVDAVLARLIAVHGPDLVVIACNTASTLVLPSLRARHAIPFVGTVPAIKPAALQTRTGHVAVLGTPGTVKRDYTRALIDAYAKDVAVTLVGSTGLATLAEAHLKGEPIADKAIRAEIAPCFVEAEGRPADVVVLACTHYPLLIERYRGLAPWPVAWLDPAPAIARRAAELLGEQPKHCPAPAPAQAVFTGEAEPSPTLRKALAGYGLEAVAVEPMPLRAH